MPFYDRSDLIALTTRTVEDNLLRGIVLVVVVLIFFLYDIRSGLIVAVTIPLSLLFAFICLDLRTFRRTCSRSARSTSASRRRRGGDGGEHLSPAWLARHGTQYSIREVDLEAAAEVDRPIVYAVAVIVAGFLPIYVLSGPSGKLFRPMADTTIFALVGSLVADADGRSGALCALVLRAACGSGGTPPSSGCATATTRGLDWCLSRTARHGASASLGALRRLAAARRRIGARVHAESRRGRALGARDDAVHDLVRGVVEDRAADPQILHSFPRGHRRRVGARPPRRRHRPDRLLQRRVLRRPQAVQRMERPVPHQGRADRGDRQEAAVFPGITFNYTQPAEDAVDEAQTGLKSALDVKVFGTDLARSRGKGQRDQAGARDGPRHQHVTLVQELGQPSLTISVDRAKIARYGLNVADVNGLIEAAVGGVGGDTGGAGRANVRSRRAAAAAVSARRRSRSATSSSPRRTASRSRCARSPTSQVANGASFIYRQDNSRYIGVQYSVEGRDLASAVQDARAAGAKAGPAAAGLPRRLGRRVSRSTRRRGHSCRWCCRSRSF